MSGPLRGLFRVGVEGSILGNCNARCGGCSEKSERILSREIDKCEHTNDWWRDSFLHDGRDFDVVRL